MADWLLLKSKSELCIFENFAKKKKKLRQLTQSHDLLRLNNKQPNLLGRTKCCIILIKIVIELVKDLLHFVRGPQRTAATTLGVFCSHGRDKRKRLSLGFLLSP